MKQSDWIPVSKRLPPMNTPVIVYHGPDVKFMGIGGRIEGEDGWLWAVGERGDIIDNDADLAAEDDYHITHWMPLPKPPRKGAR
jgi:uncharacterized protein DUF551